MSTLSPENHAATKVIVKACHLADRRRAVHLAPQGQKAREVGRYEKSVDELIESVEKYRKNGGQP